MEKEATILVGNGFNFFISNYVNNSYYYEEIIKKLKTSLIYHSEEKLKEILENIQCVLKEYCSLLDGITLSTDYNKTGEYLLQQLSDFCDKINDPSGLVSIEKAICEKIKKDMYTSEKDSNIQSIPVTIRTIFKYYNEYFSEKFVELMKNQEIAKTNVITTNYDGIVEEVFKKSLRGKTIHEINYIPLHGEYYNKNIICSAPAFKEGKINSDLLNQLDDGLNKSEIIILFGIGLTSDPHILKRLNEVYEKKIIIIDACREQYLQRNYYLSDSEKLGFDFLFNNSIYFINTGKPTFTNDYMEKPIETPIQLLNKLSNILNNQMKG
ncbi:hypothetical protein M2475_000831 [Breznakia sp. PF5-3]|uniref:hypothetical protein n=1 Tax=unclassified Breznakia TaxID=2623764 RepID=UPI002405064F|nr:MULTISPECIES: hypothetical protein [unclassified Breznakia]MDF9824451.1 hypothetical protein [Breznakia sp. PM6-1]MDF9835266.1 hypothetical protein [Breznakia sp. PF5-3]MDF9837406.1 hypothetical protein [Breznakia sp. PFB2-8]MDF9859341.1 hypothetical protein [Breznakia sp. PH5-24]